MRDPAERVRDILEAIAAIERYANRDKKTFEKDELVQTWFLRHLQIIGEAPRAIPEDVRALAPEVPWHKITGMRNVLVHGYFEIDADLVWDAATRDVGALKPAIQHLATTLKRGKSEPTLAAILLAGNDQYNFEELTADEAISSCRKAPAAEIQPGYAEPDPWARVRRWN